MNKRSADKIALVMARDILRTSSQEPKVINQYTAQNIAAFVETLSAELQKLVDDGVTSGDIIKAYNSQSAK